MEERYEWVGVAEQVALRAGVDAVLLVLRSRKRAWLQPLVQVARLEGLAAAGAAGPDAGSGDRHGVTFGRPVAVDDGWRQRFRWVPVAPYGPCRDVEGVLELRPGAAGGSTLGLQGRCLVPVGAGRVRTRLPHEVLVRSLLGGLRNVIESALARRDGGD